MPSSTTAKKLPSSDKNYYEQARLETLAEILSYRYDELFESLGVSLAKTQKMYIGCCPIHGGDNASALNLYSDGYAVKGFWKCRTHHCEQIFKKTLIGFVRGVLSNKKGWSNPDHKNKLASFKETIDWCCKFIGQPLENIEVNTEEIANKKFVAQMAMMVKDKASDKGISREKVRKNLKIPAKFFVDKGYTPQILDNYDIGFCDNEGKEMFERVVAPIYDENRKHMVACTGRSIHDKCKNCALYHNPASPCPTNEKYKELKYSKWRNSANSNVSSYLYNYWSAKRFIRETGTMILVEGPADVWKLEELGIHNAVALFGVEMSDEQQVIIEMSGALNVVILLDMDPPGRVAAAEIKRKLERSYRVFVPELSVNDPGDYDSTIVANELIPILRGISK